MYTQKCAECSQTGVWCVIEEVQVAQADILSLLMNHISALYDALRKRANTVKVADQPEVLVLVLVLVLHSTRTCTLH